VSRPASISQRAHSSIRVLTRRNLAQIYEHASRCYPEECCGFIYASGRVHRAVNDQSRLHDEDPINFPRTSREAYSLSAGDLLILNESLASSDPPVIIYHSHADVGAYFSDHDVANAVHEGRLVYDVDFLVVDARKAGPRGSKLFRYTTKGFECVWSDTDNC
jgi:proteasome lid subunit RPN8/RPN11